MYMNQIKENIACNSEYYAGILDTNIIDKSCNKIDCIFYYK